MIIWINGAYGSGKSTLAEVLSAKLADSLIFDAEEVGNAVRGSYPDCPYGYIFEDYPLWSDFCCRLIEDVHDKFSENIIVPMTLLRPASYDSIIKRLIADGYDARMVILQASRQTVHDRIIARGEDEDCWCMENIELSSQGSSAMDGLHILTDDKSPEEIADIVMAQLL